MNAKNKIIITFSMCVLIALGSTTASGQSVLMEQDVNADTVISQWGKNKAFYFSTYFGYAVPLGNVEGSDSVQLKSGAGLMIDYSTYFKLRLAQWYSLVADAGYRLNTFSFDNDDENVKYERIVASNIHIGLYNRFNFDLKRGNTIGKYLELGASANYAYTAKKKIKRLNEDSDEFNYTRLVVGGPSYINRLNYYAEAHLGFDKFVITGAYRISDFLDNEVTGFNLPPLSIGLRVDFGG